MKCHWWVLITAQVDIPLKETHVFVQLPSFFVFLGGWIRNLLSRIVILMTGQPTTPSLMYPSQK